MVCRFETSWGDKEIMVLQSLKVLHLSVIPDRFYNSPNLKDWMCELCTLSQSVYIHKLYIYIYNLYIIYIAISQCMFY